MSSDDPRRPPRCFFPDNEQKVFAFSRWGCIYLYVTMLGALGTGTTAFPVHGVPKTKAPKSSFLAGSGPSSGSQNRSKKVRKTDQGPPAVMEEKKGQTRSLNERHRIDKIGVSCKMGGENQEARVFDLHEKKLGKRVVKRAGIT